MEDECIICFETIETELVYPLFECNHIKNMHLECIFDLKLCPLCRAPRLSYVHICIFVINEKHIRIFGTGLLIILYFIFFSGLYIAYHDIKQGIHHYNVTM